MKNAEIAAIFEDIARRLELKKDNIFKIRAYRRVARSIEELPVEVAELAGEDRLGEIDGAGEAITKKLTELKEENPELYRRKFGLSFKKYGRIAEVAKENPELAEVLKQDLELMKKQRELLAKIRTATDDEKKELTKH